MAVARLNPSDPIEILLAFAVGMTLEMLIPHEDRRNQHENSQESAVNGEQNFSD